MAEEKRENTMIMWLLYGVAQLSGLMAVICTVAWLSHFRGGYAWQSDPHLQFSWHPTLMILSMIYLYGNGIVVYRIFLNENTLRVLRPLNVDKKKVKLAHAIIMGSALPLMVIGLKAVFDNHDLRETPIPNMYSLHSWVGIICVILFFTQWVCGLVTFLAPGLAPRLRALYLPVHVYFGMLIFILAFASVISGITEIAIFTIKDPKYAAKPPQGILVNWIGLLTGLFCALIIYLASTPQFKPNDKKDEERGQGAPSAELSTIESENQYQKPQL